MIIVKRLYIFTLLSHLKNLNFGHLFESYCLLSEHIHLHEKNTRCEFHYVIMCLSFAHLHEKYYVYFLIFQFVRQRADQDG